MKQYFVILIIGLFVAGICLCTCPANVSAEPVAINVVPKLPGEDVDVEVVDTSRMRSLAGWETASFSASQMKTIVEDAADALVNAQDGTTKGWAFDLADTSTAYNIYGVTGLGLLRAYNLTKNKTGASVTAGNPGYLTAAGDVADAIIDGNFPLQATDYIFLKSYSDISGDANYAIDAAADLQSAIIDGNTAGEVADWLDTIDNDQGKLWQLANWVEVFQMYSQTTYADAVVTKIFAYDLTAGTGADKVRGFAYDTTNSYVRTVDQARVVEILKRYYSTTYATEIAEGLALLKDLQYNNGYFRFACQLNVNDVTLFPSVMVQDQAFAVKAMAFNAQTTFENYDNHLGAFWGANALMEMQDLDGGFTTDKQTANISEYNAEALDALHRSCKEGDVDRSGKVMPWDALDALKAAVDAVDLAGPALLAADRNGDGEITAMDALKILQVSVGKDITVCVGGNIALVP